MDPDEGVDPAMLNGEHLFDREEDDDESMNFEASSESSLQTQPRWCKFLFFIFEIYVYIMFYVCEKIEEW